MTQRKDKFTYRFSDIVLIGHRSKGRTETTWYINCPQCHGEHMFRKAGSKIWHTSCVLAGVEWTITPAEYHVSKKCDMTKILGEE